MRIIPVSAHDLMYRLDGSPALPLSTHLQSASNSTPTSLTVVRTPILASISTLKIKLAAATGGD